MTAITAADVRAFDSSDWESHFSGARVHWSSFTTSGLREVARIAGEHGDLELAHKASAALARR